MNWCNRGCVECCSEYKMEFLVSRFVRILLHLFNAILLGYGIFLTVCGFMIVQDIRVYDHFVESKIFWLPYFIIFNGIMMIVCSLLGYLGTCQQDYKLLFAVSTIIVLLIEIALVTWASTQNPSYTDSLRITLRRSFSNYLVDEADKSAWHRVQRRTQCCGVDGPQNWSKFYTKNQVPASCCTIAADQPGALCLNTPNSQIVYQYGCHPILIKRISDHWSVVSLLAAIATFLQLVILALSISMAFLVKRAKIARERQ